MACDRCGKRSYLHVTKGQYALNFCGHHATEHRDALEVEGWTFEWDLEGLKNIGAKVPA
jgi:hypothetical protein